MKNNNEKTMNEGNNLDDDEAFIVLYYYYSPVAMNIEKHISFQKESCECLDLKGRIRVSEEGVNGVLSGTSKHLKTYEARLREELSRDAAALVPSHGMKEKEEGDNFVENLDMKYCRLRDDIPVEAQLFDSLSVKETKVIVSLFDPATMHGDSQPNIPVSRNYWRKRRRNRKPLTQENNPDAKNKDNPMAQMESFEPSPHLSPQQWHKLLLDLSSDSNDECILLDARNVYESKIGFFEVPGIPTLLTNTRKYSNLPNVLEHAIPHLAGKSVFMYCTGGVRCERASQYLQTLADSPKWKGEKPKQIYQLSGGIQRYLETFGTYQPTSTTNNHSNTTSPPQHQQCLFRGKNFVFDPRRTDPVIGPDTPGRCILCRSIHDDYDNSYAPCRNREARCCRCRVLILICPACRSRVRAWGENQLVHDNDDTIKPELFCGHNGTECIDEGNFVQFQIIN